MARISKCEAKLLEVVQEPVPLNVFIKGHELQDGDIKGKAGKAKCEELHKYLSD